MSAEPQEFCWGVLFHMLGSTDLSQPRLAGAQKAKDSRLADLSECILRCEKTYEQVGRLHTDPNDRPGPKIAADLKEIVCLVGRLLDPEPGTGEPRLGYECPAEPSRGRSKDNSTEGYSRSPFKQINSGDRTLLCTTALLYLLRSHALFFCRPKPLRNYDAAKVALNDLHQAVQIAWRLYQNLPMNHHSPQERDLDAFYNAIIGLDAMDQAPCESPYFVFSLLVLCDIFRGNVYQEIDYIEEADRHYRHALQRLNGLLDYVKRQNVTLPDQHMARWFYTLTVARAMYTQSKVQFDLGRFLKSLANQLRTILCLIRLSSQSTPSSEADDVIRRLEAIITFLKAERASPMYDRERITQLFADTTAAAPGWDDGISDIVFRPEQLVSIISPEYARLAAQVLARVGFTLYTIQPRVLARDEWDKDRRDAYAKEKSERTTWLTPYFGFDDIWNKGRDRAVHIRHSDLGRYCQTLLDNSLPGGADIFPDQIERRFALLLRELLKRQPDSGPPESDESMIGAPYKGKLLEELDFYKAILASTTQNIANLVTIPRRNGRILFRRGYRYRRLHGDLSQKTVYDGLQVALGDRKHGDAGDAPVNKLVVLRRWQSFNPKIPRPNARKIRGGGYFLFWHNRGIVIDPGYDFIQNFYDEGFSLEDIDAIIVTHSHPDHDDDLSSLTTLVSEWNEFHEHTGHESRQRILDLFLNSSTQRKFSAWLQASDVRIGRIIPLPCLRWDKDTRRPDEGKLRGENVRIVLKTRSSMTGGRLGTVDPSADPCDRPSPPAPPDDDDGYDMIIEVVPAWHDDIIGKTVAVGLKFHLLSSEGDVVGILGYTGDTGAYGLSVTGEDDPDPARRIDCQYKDCDVLIAHLGDIRLRELASAMEQKKFGWDRKLDPHPLLELLESWFDKAPDEKWKSRVQEYLDFVETLHLVPHEALQINVDCADGEQRTVQRWLGDYIEDRVPLQRLMPKPEWDIDAAFRQFRADCCSAGNDIPAAAFWSIRVRLCRELSLRDLKHVDEKTCMTNTAYLLLALVSACSLIPWQYPYHLGIFGVYRLFTRMATGNRRNHQKVFIIGELPEELTSYRHMIAHWLNVSQTQSGYDRHADGTRAFTGDIGLNVGLTEEHGAIVPRVRCTFCNYNNELVCHSENYHSPSKVYETPIKRLSAAMIYLCTVRDHHPESPHRPHHFLSLPELRVL